MPWWRCRRSGFSRLPKTVCAALTWVGLAGIAFGAVVFNGNTAYPGSLVAIPVVGAAFVIAGGTRTPPWAAESVLKRGPFQWFGKLSYSIYLWHWPLLIIAADVAGTTSLPFRRNIIWLVIALAASVASFYLVENPLRHARLSRFGRWTPIGLGAVLIAVSLIVATVEIDVHAAPPDPDVLVSSRKAERHYRALPDPSQRWNRLFGRRRKSRRFRRTSRRPSPMCDPPGVARQLRAGRLSVNRPFLLACSETSTAATRWSSTATRMPACGSNARLVATRIHWRLAYLGKGYCPANSLAYGNPHGFGSPGGEYSVCDRWHSFALDRINRLHPDLVIITQEVRNKPDGKYYSPAQWQQGLAKTISLIHVPKNRIVVLGNVPVLPTSGPECLSQHPDDVQACSGPVAHFFTARNQAEEDGGDRSRGALCERHPVVLFEHLHGGDR